MVRFEKLPWEKFFNIKALGRERVFGAPTKWFKRNVYDDMVIAQHNIFDKGVSGFIFRFFEPLFAYYFYHWPKDIAHNKGLALEDYILHTDREQRRDMFFETVNRESCHPYQHLFYRKRRARYFKVEKAIRGFKVPDYIYEEGEDRLAADTGAAIEEWQDHLYNNYYSDMTPVTRYTAMHRLIPLEVFNVYGILKGESWERYFMNEVETDDWTDKDDQVAEAEFLKKWDLETEEGRRKFEAWVNRFAYLYPGSIAHVGEQFNFKEFYIRNNLALGKDTSKFDQEDVEEAIETVWDEEQDISSQTAEEEWIATKPSTLGTEFPARLRSKNRKVLM